MNRLLIIILTFTVIACQPDPIPIELEQAESKLVVASQIVPNRIMLVSVTRSFSALDYGSADTSAAESLVDQLAVDSAVVVVKHAGNTDTLSHLGGGLYLSLGLVQSEGGLFELEVHDTITGQAVYSETTMMSRVALEEIKLRNDEQEFFAITEVDLSWEDQDDDNYYLLNFYNRLIVAGDTLPFALDSNIKAETVLLSDLQLSQNGPTYTHQLFDWDSDTVIVTLSNISKGYFNYLTARQRSGSGFSGAFGEPVTYPSNVLGGYGYFSAHFPSLQAGRLSDQ